MSIIVHKTTLTSDDTIDTTIYVNQNSGDDTAVIGDGKSAKTLQHALDMVASNEAKGKVCEIRIVSDYVIAGTETLSKASFRKCIITCADGVYISGLKSITDSASKTTNIFTKEILKSNGEYIEVSHSCDKLDILNYIPFKVSSVQEYIDTGSTNTNKAYIIMSVPDNYSMRVGQILDIQTGWVNATGYVTKIDGSSMTVFVISSNYQITTSANGYYRILNYSTSDGSFCASAVDDIDGDYQITTSLQNFRIPQKSILKLEDMNNVVFKNCNFRSINNGSNQGILLSSCYGLRFEGCVFEHVNMLRFSSGEDLTVVDNYFYDSPSVYSSGKHIYVAKNLFKGSYASLYNGVTFERNEMCYSLTAINGGGGGRIGNSNTIHNQSIIQYNEIHHIGLLMKADYGAIYRGGATNEVIQYNYVHDCVGRNMEGSITGIYCDEGSYGNLVRYNLIVNCTSSTYTHYGRGNIFYNNLFAYPTQTQLKYSGKITHECASSYIANIFYGGALKYDYFSNLQLDGSMFQFNVLDVELPIDDSVNVHSNAKGTPPFIDAPKGNFELSSLYSIGKVSMGSTDVRRYNQSTIDTSFFDHKVGYGLPTDSKWYSKRGIAITLNYEGVSYPYDKWFILVEMELYSVTNDYLTEKLN